MKNTLIGFIVAFIFFMTLSFYNRNEKVGYVDNKVLFNQFTGKKELQQKLDHLSSKHKIQLDSIQLRMRKITGTNKNENTSNFLRQQETLFLRMEQEFAQEYQQKSNEYTDMIWSQINQYTREFGREEGYDFIHGTSGEGTLMYANEKHDLTQEILTYINLKYEGF